MESYKLVIKKSAAKEIERIPKQDRIRVVEKIRSLCNDPRPTGCKKLSAQDRYRIRQGSYRILYQIVDEELVVCVVRVGHRKDVYQK